MFVDLPAEDRQAFFDLLDEYFSARPHLLGGSGGAGGDANVHAAAGTLLSAAARDPQMRSAALGAARGAAANAGVGRSAAAGSGSKGPPPAPPANKLSGLVSGKSLGSISTASKGAAFSSMIGRKPSTTAPTPPASRSTASSAAPLPPPARRGTGGPTSPPPPAYPATPARQNVGEAVALYEYTGTDADDLPVAEGERVLLLEKVSDDWWKAASMDGAREGLVPSAYVQVQT